MRAGENVVTDGAVLCIDDERRYLDAVIHLNGDGQLGDIVVSSVLDHHSEVDFLTNFQGVSHISIHVGRRCPRLHCTNEDDLVSCTSFCIIDHFFITQFNWVHAGQDAY